MPNFEEHCESTLKKLGCRFEKVHRWMDEPSHVMGRNHRIRRHDPFKTPEMATEIFSKDYPEYKHLIGEAVLDHIMLDAKSGVLKKEEEPEPVRDIKDIISAYGENTVKKCQRYLDKALEIGGLDIIYPAWKRRSMLSTFLFGRELDRRFLLEYNCFYELMHGLIKYRGEFQEIERFPLFGSSVVISLRRKGYKGYVQEIRIKENEEEDLDFLSEENLEAQGIPSSAVMDMEDEEE